jgi:hypothetical protein
MNEWSKMSERARKRAVERARAWRKLHGRSPTESKTPRAKFNYQKHQAKFRGIAFLLTFDQWFAIWQ